MKFNINEYVHVQLTDFGRKTLKDAFDKFDADMGNMGSPYIAPIEDEDGWSRWQMWELMLQLGHLLVNGGPTPFNTNIILGDERN